MWEIGRRLGHYSDHPCPRVADRGTPSRVDKRVAPDREGAVDKQCHCAKEKENWSQYVITNREEGKGKPPRLFPKTGYPLGYPEPAPQQKTEERLDHISDIIQVHLYLLTRLESNFTELLQTLCLFLLCLNAVLPVTFTDSVTTTNSLLWFSDVPFPA